MLRCTIVAAMAVATIGLGACGADDSVGDRVPKTTPDLTVPTGGESLAGGTGSNAAGTTTTDSTTSTPAAGAQSDPAAGSGGAATPAPAPAAPQPEAQGQGTGGAAPQQEQPAQTPKPGATGGASLDQFCADNPGACGN